MNIDKIKIIAALNDFIVRDLDREYVGVYCSCEVALFDRSGNLVQLYTPEIHLTQTKLQNISPPNDIKLSVLWRY